MELTFHGVVEECKVVLGAWIETSSEVPLQSPFNLDFLHDDSQLLGLLLAARLQSQVVRVTLGQHPTEVLLNRHHLNIYSTRNTCNINVDHVGVKIMNVN